MQQFQSIIEDAWENRASLQPGTAQLQALELMPAGITLYALEEDLQARALSAPARALAIDYPAFVELCGRYAKVNSWL